MYIYIYTNSYGISIQITGCVDFWQLGPAEKYFRKDQSLVATVAVWAGLW